MIGTKSALKASGDKSQLVSSMRSATTKPEDVEAQVNDHNPASRVYLS